jgi:hypothetical protein
MVIASVAPLSLQFPHDVVVELTEGMKKLCDLLKSRR